MLGNTALRSPRAGKHGSLSSPSAGLAPQTLPGLLLSCRGHFHPIFHSVLFSRSLWQSHFFPLLSSCNWLKSSHCSYIIALAASKPLHLQRYDSPPTHPPLSRGVDLMCKSHHTISLSICLHTAHRQSRFLSTFHNPHSRIYPAISKIVPIILCSDENSPGTHFMTLFRLH